MTSTIVELYRQKLFTLVKTITIKQLECARAINNHLTSKGYVVDQQRPETWKYFLNLSGEYHPYDRDLLKTDGGVMTVKVAGATGPVDSPFTKELVQGEAVDNGTASEYTFGSRRYKELVARYPTLELLIRGILNPIDIKLAISVPNNTILYCGGYFPKRYSPLDEDPAYVYLIGDRYTNETALIEPQETNLIPKLQQYINLSMEAYNTQEYEYIDDLYIPTLLARLYALMPGQIDVIRLNNIKTPFVHSFHVREYLESYGYMGQYVDDIPLDQAMWLYRNADYLSLNKGRQSTFDDIVNNMLTPTQIPINGFKLRQDTTYMEQEITSRSLVEREIINLKQIGASSEIKTIRDLLEAEAKVTKSNYIYLDEDENHITDEFVMGRKGIVDTKALESVVIDYSNPAPFDLNVIMLNMWLFTASRGDYTGTIYITHPYTGDRIQLTPLNAYILMLYCLYQGVGLDLPAKIPTINANWIPIVPNAIKPTKEHGSYPTLTDLRNVTHKDHTSLDALKHLFDVPTIRYNHNSVLSFKRECNSVYEGSVSRYYTSCMADDHVSRADLEYAMRMFYWDSAPCELSKRSFPEWLTIQGLDLSALAKEEYVAMAIDIASKATGADTSSTERLRRLQNAMVNILRHHSSYTVQYLAATTLSSPWMSNAKAVRMSQPIVTAYAHWFLSLGQIDAGLNVTSAGRWLIDIYELDDELSHTFVMSRDIHWSIDLGSVDVAFTNVEIDHTINLGRVSANSWHIPYAANNNDFVPLDF